jgi:hypothetical protein
MNDAHPEESQTALASAPRASEARPSDARCERQNDAQRKSAGETGQPATVLVRGETIREPEPKSPAQSSSANGGGEDKDKEAKDKSPRKEVSAAKVRMQNRLPTLDDDADIGVQKDHVVTRDGKADLAFTGTLIACAAPPSAPKGEWQEYRIYTTNGGKHVFAKVTRNVLAAEQDAYEAEVFDPSPSSMPSQLLRSARDLTRSHPLTWTDAAVAFFGYDPLAKALYRKLGGQFEEHIS